MPVDSIPPNDGAAQLHTSGRTDGTDKKTETSRNTDDRNRERASEAENPRSGSGRTETLDKVEIRREQINITKKLDDDDPNRKSPQPLEPTRGAINLTA
ncbi:MAG: hypothetical protein GF401_00955 [Chitinivibrionales bacterium]|nr:hypothetical protein [Chitinivibrionales bacterium]